MVKLCQNAGNYQQRPTSRNIGQASRCGLALGMAFHPGKKPGILTAHGIFIPVPDNIEALRNSLDRFNSLAGRRPGIQA